MSYAYVFECKGVQQYLFATGRLRTAVAASELLTQIARSDGNDWVEEAIEAAGKPGIEVARRAGGAVVLVSDQQDALIRIRSQLNSMVQLRLPGLEFGDAIGTGEDTMAAIRNAYVNAGGRRQNSAASVLPRGNPLTERAPQTGRPGLASDPEIDLIAEPVWAEATASIGRTVIWDKHAKANGAQDGSADDGGVASRLHPRAKRGSFSYPRDLSPDELAAWSAVAPNGRNAPNTAANIFPWLDSRDPRRRLAIVHADLSGLGEAFQAATIATARDQFKLGKEIEAAIVAAVRAATNEVLIPEACPQKYTDSEIMVVPARPLLIGGDDITVLVRADLALPFAMTLLKSIEDTTKDIQGGLSACAGVAIGGSKHPFLLLNELAESLCSHAKSIAKSKGKPATGPYPSLMSFHVQTATGFEHYGGDILPTVTANGLVRTGNPYGIGKGATPWEALVLLARAIQATTGAANALRRIESALAEADLGAARALWMQLRQGGTRAAADFKGFDAAMKAAGINPEEPFDGGATPLFDASTLISLGTLSAAALRPVPSEAAG